MKLTRGKFNISLGGQLGSEGKGLLNNYIAVNNHIDIAVSNSSTNSGHTFYYHNKKHIVKHLPVSGIINTRSCIYLCPGAIINPVQLLKEIETFNIDPCRLYIHPRCAIIEDYDIKKELVGNTQALKIASTQNGVGAALVRKINRTARLAESINCLKPFIKRLDLHSYLDDNLTIFMEVPQGLDLSINSGLSYPYCTSREITVSSAMSDAQVHPSYLGKTAVCIRTFPIRVGNISYNNKELGYSGPFYSDSKETSWEDIGVKPELTTNTKRTRRVSSFSMLGYSRMLNCFRPDYLLLNFANYMNKIELNILLDRLPEVTHLGFGKTIDKIHKL